MGIASALMSVLTSGFYIFLVAFVIGVIIFVHELGHFLAAKRVGVRVDAFSLGFGPVLLGYKKGETEYRLSLVPIGGYVKMAGEHVGDSKDGLPDEFQSRTVGERAFIVVAGVALHIVFAFLVFIAAFRIGVPFPAAEVGAVEVGSPAWVAGIQAGDEIVKINGKSDVDYEELFCASALSNGYSIRLRVKRPGEDFAVTVKPKYDDVMGTFRIGVRPQRTTTVEKIYGYKEESNSSPAARAGIQVGDVITGVNDVKIHSWQDLSRELRSRPGEKVTLTIRRGQKTLKKELVTKSICRPRIIGIVGETETLDAVRKRTLAYDKVGFRSGDRVLAVDGTPIRRWREFADRMAAEAPVKTVTVDRGGKDVSLSLEGLDRRSRVRMLRDLLVKGSTTVTAVKKGFPAEEAGIRPGDTIVSIDGQKIEKWAQIRQAVAENDGEEMAVVVERDGKVLPPFKIVPREDPENAQGYIGIVTDEKRVIKKYGLWESCVVGCRKAITNMKRVYLTLTGLLTKKVAIRNIGGIILIAQASYYSALQGMGKLLYFVAVIAVNLAVVNMLPIPLLDGGLLLFLVIEKIKGGPVSEGAQRVAQYVGLAVLLTLMVVVCKNDIVRLIQMYSS
ncbi:MAG: RIP metalloprotease RseP [Planctomycetes bacterium]|nr:RIP metalloprotease RseP [Planctomycetota bacterium]